MNTLNLIYPEASDIGYTSMIFPDGQPHLKLDMATVAKLDLKAPVRILARSASANDLLFILLAKNVLDYHEFEHIELHLSYLLAARMDRVMLDGEPFSLKVISVMLNSAGFKKILIFDPHSEVSTALIDRAYPVNNHAFVNDAMNDYFSRHNQENYSIVSPDAGALKKIYKLAQALNIARVIECTKERDVKTGQLLSFKTTNEHIAGETCFIIDDICDGGGTFAGTASMLKEKGAGKIILIVSHGIFSKGIAIGHVDAIYCTDSYRHLEGVHCFPIARYL